MEILGALSTPNDSSAFFVAQLTGLRIFQVSHIRARTIIISHQSPLVLSNCANPLNELHLLRIRILNLLEEQRAKLVNPALSFGGLASSEVCVVLPHFSQWRFLRTEKTTRILRRKVRMRITDLKGNDLPETLLAISHSHRDRKSNCPGVHLLAL